jgi:alpha-beta hydrolase superfamily lysophospholipase
MTPCFHIEIVTPKKVVLNGLLFNPKKTKSVFIFVHGLAGSAFSMGRLSDALVVSGAAVLTFNNRGFEQVATVKRRKGKDTEYVTAGTAHEVFVDCIDDIQGAVNFARRAGFKNVYIVGHSTGCQKAVYWASSGGRGAQGLVLLGPLSDYSGALKTIGKKMLAKGVAIAKKMVTSGNSHELMPSTMREWFECDAQRFLSLYTPDTAEDIFTYAFPEKRPRTLARVKLPVLVLLAGADEYGDKPPRHIEAWFAEHLKVGDKIVIVPRVKHGFRGGEKIVVREMRRFMR